MIRRNIAANFVGQAWTSAMAIAFVPIYIRILGIEAYGLIGFYALLQVWLTLLDAGLTPTLARETARLKAASLSREAFGDVLRSIETLLCAVGVVTALALGASSFWLAEHWLNLDRISVSEAAFSVAVMGGIIGLRFLESGYRSALLGGGWQVAYNLFAVVVATLRNGGVVAVLLLWPTVTAFFVWQLIVSVVGLASVLWILRARIGRATTAPRFSIASLRKVRGFAGGMMVITVLGLLLSQLDKLVLSNALPLAEFGYYSFSWSATLMLLALILPILNATFPALVAACESGDAERLCRLTSATSRLVALAAYPACFTLALWSGEAVLAWSNDPTLVAGSAGLIFALAFGFAANAPFQMLYHVQLASGWTRLIITVYAVALGFYVPALIAGTDRYGALAAAWLWLALNLVYVGVEGPLVFARLLNGGFLRWLLRDNLSIALAALAIPLFARLVLSEPDGRWAALAMVGAVAVGSFVSAALLVPEAREHARRWVARLGFV
jgi:O-antigen/teichoic acid export membrane protein